MKRGDKLTLMGHPSWECAVVGHWCGNIVLQHLDPAKEDLLVYTPEEIDLMISEGHARRERS